MKNKLSQIKTELLDAELKLYNKNCTCCNVSNKKTYMVEISDIIVYVCQKCKEIVCESVYVDKMTMDEMTIDEVKDMYNVYGNEV